MVQWQSLESGTHSGIPVQGKDIQLRLPAQRKLLKKLCRQEEEIVAQVRLLQTLETGMPSKDNLTYQMSYLATSQTSQSNLQERRGKGPTTKPRRSWFSTKTPNGRQTLNPKVTLHLLVAGLQPDPFTTSLAKRKAESMDELRDQSRMFIYLEEFEKTSAQIMGREDWKIKGPGPLWTPQENDQGENTTVMPL